MVPNYLNIVIGELMVKFFLASILLCLFLTGCTKMPSTSSLPVENSSESSHSSLASDIQKPEEFGGFMMKPEMQEVNVSVAELQKEFQFDSIISFTWLDNDSVIIECENPLSEGFITRWILADLTTGSATQVFAEESKHFISIYQSVYRQEEFIISKRNGDIIKLNNWEIQELEELDLHNLTSTRNLLDGSFYFTTKENKIVQDSNGEQTVLYTIKNEEGKPRQYPRVPSVSPNGDKLVFSIMVGNALSHKTVVIDLTSLDVKEIPQPMIMPVYFWLEGEFFAMENTDIGAKGITNFYKGYDLQKVHTETFNENSLTGYCDYNSRKYGLGSNGKLIPLIYNFDNDKERVYQLTILNKGLEEKIVYTTTKHIQMATLSPDGDRVIFLRTSNTVENMYDIVILQIPD